MTTFQVRFYCYAYSGGGECGVYHEFFPTLVEAEKFAKVIKNVIKYNNSRRFLKKHHYVYDGCIDKLLGIWQVTTTEEKIE